MFRRDRAYKSMNECEITLVQAAQVITRTPASPVISIFSVYEITIGHA